MLRVFLILIAVFFSSQTNVFAAQEIDVESLGLDNVDEKKAAEAKIIEVPQSQKIEVSPAIEALSKIQHKVQNLVSEKIAPLIKKEEKPAVIIAPVKQQKLVKKPVKKGVAKKKKVIKKAKKIPEISYEEMQKQLEELREKYLQKAKKYENFDAENTDEDFLQDDEIAMPQRKNLNPFVKDEAPAVPLLNHYRTADNLHIPFEMTMREKIEILFGSITYGNYAESIENFNAAYKNVENPNAINLEGDTLLTYAILLRRYPMIAALIAKGADLEMPNALAYNPATIAIEMRDFKTFEMLVKNNLNLNYHDFLGQTYLMYAARAGFLPAVELLISRGVDVNEMSNDGETALTFAYRYKQEVVAKFLLKSGAKMWIEKPYEPDEQSLIKELENRWK